MNMLLCLKCDKLVISQQLPTKQPKIMTQITVIYHTFFGLKAFNVILYGFKEVETDSALATLQCNFAIRHSWIDRIHPLLIDYKISPNITQYFILEIISDKVRFVLYSRIRPRYESPGVTSASTESLTLSLALFLRVCLPWKCLVSAVSPAGNSVCFSAAEETNSWVKTSPKCLLTS